MKKALMAALVAATSLSTPSIAYVGDTFIGENGGVRVVQSISFEGDIANIEVETTNSRGRVKTRTFHVRRDETGQYQADSRGTPEFQQFLIDQAQEARDAIVEQEFTITAENTTIWELADMFPHLDILAFTDGIDLNEEETRELVAAGVDLDSFWFTYDLSYVDYVPTFTFSDGLTITDEGTGTPEYLESPIQNHRPYGFSGHGLDVYDIINIDAIEQAHNQGWTGSSNTTIAYFSGTPLTERTTGVTHFDKNDASTWSGNTQALHDIALIAPNSNYAYVGGYDYDALNGANIVIDTHVPSYTRQSTRTLVRNTVPAFQTQEERGNEYVEHHNKVLSHADNPLIIRGVSTVPTEDTIEANPNATIYYRPDFSTLITYEGCEAINWFGPSYRRVTQDSCTAHKWLYDANADTSTTIIVGTSYVDGEPRWLDTPFQLPGERAKNDFISVNTRDRGLGGIAATGVVAGVAALVQHKFGTNAVNTKKIILETADDYGEPGPDPVWGYGVLNVGAALSPVGNLR